MKVHLVDGTFELFRHHFGRPSHVTASGQEVAATRGVLASLLDLLESGATHVGVATDHVIESFRNQLWPGYKTGAATPPALASQFGLLEEAVGALGLVVWPMVELEADDALASAASVAAADDRVEQVVICTPDKDLAQCVSGDRVVQLDRRAGHSATIGEAGVWTRFGVAPASIPDWLALVGDSSDGFPGLAGWGARSATTILARYSHLEAIPDVQGRWEVSLRGGAKLAATLAANRDLAFLFRDLATLRIEPGLLGGIDRLAWSGPTPGFGTVARSVELPGLYDRARRIADSRAGDQTGQA